MSHPVPEPFIAAHGISGVPIPWVFTQVNPAQAARDRYRLSDVLRPDRRSEAVAAQRLMILMASPVSENREIVTTGPKDLLGNRLPRRSPRWPPRWAGRRSLVLRCRAADHDFGTFRARSTNPATRSRCAADTSGPICVPSAFCAPMRICDFRGNGIDDLVVDIRARASGTAAQLVRG